MGKQLVVLVALVASLVMPIGMDPAVVGASTDSEPTLAISRPSDDAVLRSAVADRTGRWVAAVYDGWNDGEVDDVIVAADLDAGRR